MRLMKILGLLAVAAAAMMAFAASASATTITTTTGGSAETPTIHAVNEGGHVLLHNPEVNIECASTFEGKVESHGGGLTAKGNISSISFTGCTNNWSVTVNSPGSLEVHHLAGTHNGTVTASGMTVTATLSLSFGDITCRYKTSNTHLGTLTGGNPATLHLEAAIPFHSGSAACGTEPSALTGNYQTTGPLYVEEGSPPIALTSPTGTANTSPIHFANEGGHVSLHNPEANIECSSTLEATAEATSDGTASGNIGALSFTGCTGGWTVTVNVPGQLAFHATSGYNGTVTSSSMTTTATLNLIFFHITCRYKTAASPTGTHIGTLTGGNPATLHLEAAIPFHSGSAACGTEPSALTGDYQTTDALYIEEGPQQIALTSPTGTANTSPIHFANEGGHVSLHNPEANIECASTLEATVEDTDPGTASGEVNSLSFSGCTGAWSVSVQSAGDLELHATSSYNGTVYSDGLTTTGTLNLIFFHITCRYKTENTHLGTLTGGNPATLHLEAAIPFHSGSAACGKDPSALTGDYQTTDALYMDK